MVMATSQLLDSLLTKGIIDQSLTRAMKSLLDQTKELDISIEFPDEITLSPVTLSLGDESSLAPMQVEILDSLLQDGIRLWAR